MRQTRDLFALTGRAPQARKNALPAGFAARRCRTVADVALANKTACIAWNMQAQGTEYKKERKRTYTVRALPSELTPNVCLHPNTKKPKENISLTIGRGHVW